MALQSDYHRPTLVAVLHRWDSGPHLFDIIAKQNSQSNCERNHFLMKNADFRNEHYSSKRVIIALQTHRISLWKYVHPKRKHRKCPVMCMLDAHEHEFFCNNFYFHASLKKWVSNEGRTRGLCPSQGLVSRLYLCHGLRHVPHIADLGAFATEDRAVKYSTQRFASKSTMCPLVLCIGATSAYSLLCSWVICRGRCTAPFHHGLQHVEERGRKVNNEIQNPDGAFGQGIAEQRNKERIKSLFEHGERVLSSYC